MFARFSKTDSWKPYAIAAIAAGLLSANALALDKPTSMKPHVTSQGSKGDFTAADEGKSSNPVPPSPIASAEKATGADARTADAIVKALNSDKSLQGSKIKVAVANGTVTLSGSVANAAQADKAAAIAGKKAHGAKVSNSLAAG